MNKQQLKVIERAIHAEQELFTLNETWRNLYDQYNIGSIQANKIRLTLDDKRELSRLIRAKEGFDSSQQMIQDLAVLQRDEALALVKNEKMAGRKVKESRLAVKTLPGHPLKLNRQIYHLPDSGYFDTALEDIVSCQHQSILIIENYRCFDQLKKIRFKDDVWRNDPLVIFRGDMVFSENTVRLLLQKLQLPVVVMADIDPRGLLIAQSFPCLIGLAAPELPILESLLVMDHYANPDLYTKQHAGSRNQLTMTPFPLIRKIWEMLQSYQVGIVQEHWMSGDIKLAVLRLDDQG
jgi:hypothetical protein